MWTDITGSNYILGVIFFIKETGNITLFKPENVYNLTSFIYALCAPKNVPKIQKKIVRIL